MRSRVLCIVGVVLGSLVTATAPVAADAGDAAPARSTLSGQLSLGGSFSCAVVGGDVYCWGDNNEVQLGQPATVFSSNVPVAVQGATNVVQIASGYAHSCALISDGTVRCWGDNTNKQTGQTSAADTEVATAVSGISGASAVTAGQWHSCAIVSGGTVKCWGSDFDGQLGTGTGGPNSAVPLTIPGVSGATAIAAGDAHTCALVDGGRAYCWGSEFGGELGTGGGISDMEELPLLVVRNSDSAPVTGLVSITASSHHTCGLTAESTAWCWGGDMFGESGRYSQGAATGASLFKAPNESDPLTGILSISAGDYYTCMVRTGDVVSCVGQNMEGQLGSGTTGYSLAPRLQSPITIPSAEIVVASSTHTCAVETWPKVWCWGAGSSGQIGHGSTTDSFGPSLVKGVVPQTIAFPELDAKSLNDTTVTVSATSSVGAPVGLTSTTTSTCTVSGSTVTIVSTGTCTILASADAFGLYAAATPVSRSFSVSGAKPEVATGSALASATKATLNATVNGRGATTSVSFVYGTSPTLVGATTVKGADQSEDANKDVSVSIADLAVKTTYYYRAEASNALGSAQGDIKSFTTTNPEGVTINDGDEFTNSVKVTVSVVGSATAAKAELSNDGGFKNSTTFDLTNGVADIPWTLVSSKQGTFTKIVYVRLVTRFGTNLPVVSDDIILDTTKPIVAAAEATYATASNKAVAVARAKKVAKGVKLTVKGSDTVSGVGSIEVRSSAKKKPTVIAVKKVRGKTDGKPRALSQTVVLGTSAKTLQFRIVDRAGNTSKWERITVK